MRKFILVTAFLIAAALPAMAQQLDTSKVSGDEGLEQQIENYAERSDLETDYTDWIDDLNALKDRPVNLNSGDENELRRLVLLNELQIKNLIDYTTQYGQLATIYELQTIDGFNEEIVNQILPYISLAPYIPEKFQLGKALRYGKTDVMVKYQRVLSAQLGYESASDSMRAANPNKYYLGDQNALFAKLQYTYKDFLKIGVVGDKDAGEPFLPKSDTLKKGFDFYSAHFFLKDIGRIKQLAIGDYHVQFGQGLAIWSGLSMGKAAGSVVMRKRAAALRPHASSNEYMFMRGAAATVKLGIFDLTAFYSNRKADANLVRTDTSNISEDMVSSLQQSGYHRLPSELADKGSVREIAEGGHLLYQGQRLRIGATMFHVDYSRSFQTRDVLYKKFVPGLSSNTYAGFDYSFNRKKLTLYGEFSKQIDAGLAFLQGLSFSPDPRMAVAVIYRDYQRNYFNTFSAAFGESSTNTNERGLYVGMVATPFKKITLNAFADMFRYNWLHYLVDAPSGGHEYSLQMTYNISRRGDLILSYRQMGNPVNIAVSGEKMNEIGEALRDYYRVQLVYQALPWLRLQSRVELSIRNATGKNTEHGYLIYQNFQVKPPEKGWTLNLRYALFDTDSYNARIYTYENDVPLSFSIPAFSGKGSRFYCIVNTKVNDRVTLILRFSQTWYSDRNVISSGFDQIDSNKKSDFKAVLRLRL